MSLGITSIWRARPLRLRPSIHGEIHLSSPRPTLFPLATRLRHSTLAEDLEAPQKGNINKKYAFKESSRGKSRSDSDNEVGADGMTASEDSWAAIDKLEEVLERSRFADAVSVPSHKDLSLTKKKRRNARNHHKAVTAQVYHERMRKDAGARHVDWRMVLEEMAQSTPEQSLEYIEDGIKIDVDKNVIGYLLESAGDENFGVIRRRTGATIKVSRNEPTLLLSGTRQAINSATEELRNIAGKISITRRFRPLEIGELETEELRAEQEFFIPPLTRDEGAYHSVTRITHHVGSTPMPREWTPEALMSYVISLVDTYIDPSLHSPIYQHSGRRILVDHERAVTRQLMRLFKQLPSDAAFSCSMVKLALSYMTEKGDKYLPDVRSLVVLMDRRGIPMDTDVFNILLKAPVKTRNLRKFRQTVQSMTDRGFAPNLETWILLLRMFDSVAVKSYILQALNAKNMLGTSRAIQRIAQEMVPYDANHAAIQHKDLATFLQEQDDRYGPDWLTRDAGNKVLDVLGEYGRYEDAFKLLDIMAHRYHHIPKHHTQERLAAHPDAKGFATIIDHARLQGKAPLAVNAMRKMKTYTFALQPIPSILHLLFELAWKSRLRTTIVVIWRYASLARLTSYRMRQRVAALLRGEVGSSEDPIMTARVYQELGGEALARELVGGRDILEQIEALCRRTFGIMYPRTKLAAMATKILPVAFEGYLPAIALAQVLSQSILLDFKCLRARRTNELKNLLARAKVKSVPLWRPQEGQERCVDLAPLDFTDSEMIKHDDTWEDESESEGWEATSRTKISEKHQEKFAQVYRTWQAKQSGQGDNYAQDCDTDGTDGVQRMKRLLAEACEPLMLKQMVMINPNVWDDEKHDDSTTGDDVRTQLQKQNEETILNTLGQLSKNIDSFAYELAGSSNLHRGSENSDDQGEEYWEDTESEEVGDKTGAPNTGL